MLRKRDIPLEPLMLLVPTQHLGDLELREDLFDDFCVTPASAHELEARLKHLFWRSGGGTRPELIEYGVLVPAGEAAFPLGETGLGVPLWVALTLVLVLVAGMGLMFYVFARKRAAQAQR